jgi:hypothetical protein
MIDGTVSHFIFLVSSAGGESPAAATVRARVCVCVCPSVSVVQLHCRSEKVYSEAALDGGLIQA